MLIKAALVQRGQRVFDSKSGKSRGISTCLNLASEHSESSLAECGLLRTADALRDTEQHWYAVAPEESSI
jgi:hypothetical protein